MTGAASGHDGGVGDGDLAILLLDGGYERAHYALVLAASALALGRSVVLFAAGGGVHALARDWRGLRDSGRDADMAARGVATFATLRDAVVELECGLLACEAGLRVCDLAPDALLPSVRVAGVPTFLDAARGRQVITL
ncbi:DsrE family protein [Novacetimonas pomaceti]|uniref:DsrE family protein n=1 Tax=Novacetimonas pomaceti TaxID=2021998 RepID=UPI001EEFDB1F|nr:DsrE family protein [Novacetimonas pomaceti]